MRCVFEAGLPRYGSSLSNGERTSHLWRTGFVVILCSAILVGCAGTPTQPVKPEEAVESASGASALTIKESATIGPSARSDFNAALLLLESEEYEKGIELLESVVESAPEAIAPYVNLAIAYQKLGQRGRAEERLKQALAIKPDHPVANNEYGIFLRKAGRFAEARSHYERALDTYPDFHPARKNLGILCDLYLNEWSCAIENYKAYAEAVPTDEDVKLWIVDLQRREGN